MPARVIRSEINSSASLARVSLHADLFFRALLLAVDDYGRLDARPELLRAVLFPLRPEFSTAVIEACVRELCEGDDPPLRHYVVAGRPYLACVKWEQHRGKGRRSARSKYPDPPGESASEDAPRVPRISAEILGSDGSLPRPAATVETAPMARSGDAVHRVEGDSAQVSDSSQESDDARELPRISGDFLGNARKSARGTRDEGRKEVRGRAATSSPAPCGAAAPEASEPPADPSPQLALVPPPAPEHPEAVRFAEDFRDALAKIHPTARPPTPSQFVGWVRAARLMFDRDRRPVAEARALANWLFLDACRDAEFWRGNVLSVTTFREKYDRMSAQKARAGGGASAARGRSLLAEWARS